MKIFILITFLCSLIFASDIDTNLYEGEDKETYYQSIEKQIEISKKNKLKPDDILKEEKLYLSRLRSTSSQDTQIELYNLKKITKKSFTFENYYSAISALALLRIKQNKNTEMLNSVLSKSKYSKKSILNIIEEEKQKLLSYQLQHAYYKLQEKNIEKKLELLKAHDEDILKNLYTNVKSLKCSSVKNMNEKLKRSDKEIEKYYSQKISLQINLEKALIEESEATQQLQKIMHSTEDLYQEALNRKISLQLEKSLCLLRNKKNREFFKILDEIDANIKSISGELSIVYTEEVKIVREISKEVFGSAKLFFGATLHQSKDMLEQIKGYFTSTIFVFNEQPISIFSLIKAIILIIFGFFIGKLYKRWITRLSRRWPDMSQMSIRLASNIGYYLIVFIALIIAIGSLGIDMTSISLIAGALSIGIGFGLQTVVSNLIAGIILMFERTIRIGDTIELTDTLRGRVTDMRIRSTTIKTYDNVDVVIPNSSFIQSNVINWTLDDISRRVHVPFGVAYGTDVADVKKAVLDELEESGLKYIKNDISKKPEVWMVSMNNSSVDFELLVWVEWDNRLRPNSLKSDFLILIYNALNKNGIQIPFPQLDLHVKHMP